MVVDTNINRYRQEIINFLNDLEQSIKSENRQGKNYDVTNLENYVKDFLNILDSKKFINMNAYDSNTPGIDLCDESNKECIQVTTSNTLNKLKQSVEKAEVYFSKKDKKCSDYKFIFFSLEPLKNKNHNISTLFNEIEFLTLKDIHKKVDCATINQLKQLYDIIITTVEFNLSELELIIKIISGDSRMKPKPIPSVYKIKDKIKLNNIEECRTLIEEYAVYTQYISEVFERYEENGTFLKSGLISNIEDVYYNIKINQSNLSEDAIFWSVIDNLKKNISVKEYFKTDSQMISRNITQYIKCVVVYVFCECRIFKRL